MNRGHDVGAACEIMLRGDTATIAEALRPAGYRMLVRDLDSQYKRWAESIGVIDWKIQQPKLLKAWGISNPQG